MAAQKNTNHSGSSSKSSSYRRPQLRIPIDTETDNQNTRRRAIPSRSLPCPPPVIPLNKAKTSAALGLAWSNCLVKLATLTDISIEDPDFVDLRDRCRGLTTMYGQRVYPQLIVLFTALSELCSICIDSPNPNHLQTLTSTLQANCMEYEAELFTLRRQHGFILGCFRELIDAAKDKKSLKFSLAKITAENSKNNRRWASGLQTVSLASLLLVVPAPLSWFGWKKGREKRELAEQQTAVANQLREGAEGIVKVISLCVDMQELVETLANLVHYM